MNTPAKPLTFKEEEFRGWIAQHSFANTGGRFERQYHARLAEDFPRNEEFWRHFVVPLTERITDEGAGGIHFRNGVDPVLQYICGANYSLFVHLALAKVVFEKWDDTSLDAVYTRLASAFDVFEELVIKFHLLMCECRGMKTELVDELSEDDFLKLAADYYKSEYPKLRQYYLAVGKRVPPINIPTKASLFGEFFKGHAHRANYFTISGQVRAFRNAIVHDVRVGMLNQGGAILVPKTSKVSNYRLWSAVQEAARNPDKVKQDFCEVKEQCQCDINRTIEIANELYGAVLTQFSDELYSKERSELRKRFGIIFRDDASALHTPAKSANTPYSHSFDARTESEPVYNTQDSGIYEAPPTFPI